MRQMTVAIVSTLLMSAPPIAQLGAQQIPPANGGLTSSLGQPGAWKWTAGVALGWGGRHDDIDNRGTASGQIGVYSRWLLPQRDRSAPRPVARDDIRSFAWRSRHRCDAECRPARRDRRPIM